jgi:hypothetical protein
VYHSRHHLDFGDGMYLTPLEIDLYLQGIYTRDQALDQLRWKKPNHQICITSQKVIDRYLKFVESITL